jgi:hypothetical protein
MFDSAGKGIIYLAANLYGFHGAMQGPVERPPHPILMNGCSRGLVIRPTQVAMLTVGCQGVRRLSSLMDAIWCGEKLAADVISCKYRSSWWSGTTDLDCWGGDIDMETQDTDPRAKVGTDSTVIFGVCLFFPCQRRSASSQLARKVQVQPDRHADDNSIEGTLGVSSQPCRLEGRYFASATATGSSGSLIVPAELIRGWPGGRSGPHGLSHVACGKIPAGYEASKGCFACGSQPSFISCLLGLPRGVPLAIRLHRQVRPIPGSDSRQALSFPAKKTTTCRRCPAGKPRQLMPGCDELARGISPKPHF